ncbi:hypothetical protein Oweho_1603 [Owenweeksia hongkongensis DSM 17368]|uniref:Uncharacterized protein n=1 Tax=Owenweeksia hongkongensis (strain DSM 17368 / CIP 108786 / JCM 12287 / NRRL B-23963 / UST20020801) TaxID=926562 RepID=G8QZG4_OWEHD|nr:hypothetical protein [Owenweeksia hongkongensis]AEV32592.1 hypothetical protein Oweho_1603 [Owenweeksia hongkongensis DSM 17368]
MNQHQQIYRVTYEAFSQFSSSLARTSTLDELRECLQIKAKYLFDYKYLRISSFLGEKWIHINVSSQESTAIISDSPELYPHEVELQRKGIPRVWDLSELETYATALQIPAKDLKAWGWQFNNSDQSGITLTLVANASQSFLEREVPYIKLFIEILESKLMQILLFDQIASKNDELNNALVTIQERNSEIQTIIEHQDEIISRQTNDLEQQNKQLRKIAVLNAHQVREPLSRILGLMEISPYYSADALKEEILPKLVQSSDELDIALKEVILTAEKPTNTKQIPS